MKYNILTCDMKDKNRKDFSLYLRFKFFYNELIKILEIYKIN